ncbi:MAG TPA: IclR family transcriptional regulator [Trebonia sp.]|nr:IclR family transcriptional regulator [Trebonia sp.]
MNAIEKTLSMLEAIAAADTGSSLAALSARVGVPKPTAHRILQVLADGSYVVTDGKGSYHGGPALVALAGSVFGGLEITRLARAAVLDLRGKTGHTVHLAVRNGDRACYVDKAEADRPFQMVSRVGMSIPLHCTSIGKAILAALPGPEALGLLSSAGLERRTPRTLTSARQVLADLSQVRQRGYSVDDEENEVGVRCVGAAIYDGTGQAVGAVSISALTFLLSADEVDEAGQAVVSAAAAISAALGARTYPPASNGRPEQQ